MFGIIEKNIIKSKKELIFIFVIGIIFYLNDYTTGKDTLYTNCENPYTTQLYLFLHHLLSSFLIFAWFLTSNKFILKIHIITVIIVLITQIIYRGECPTTSFININCNLPKRTLLKDFLFMTGIKSIDYIYVYFIFKIVSVIVAYKKIVN
jgi:hypothetical protein